MDAWKAAAIPVETGNLATNIVYVPKPRPGEISIEDFKKIAMQAPRRTRSSSMYATRTRRMPA